MNNHPITVISVLYHSKHLLPSLLKNIRRNIVDQDEIILIDNSNEDLSEFESPPKVKIIYPTHNIGYGAAINLGIQHAKNEIIVAMNPDIEVTLWELPNNWVFNSLLIASGIPKEWTSIRKFPTLVYDQLRLSLKNLTRPFHWIDQWSGFISLKDISEPKKVDWVSGALIITNKKTMRQLGGFDEEYFLFYEEVDLCKRASYLEIPRYILHTIQFNLNVGTSSSFDVDEIKYTSEINSVKRYHSKYSNKTGTSALFFFFKIYCTFIALALAFFNIFFTNKKLLKKLKQYYLYAKCA